MIGIYKIESPSGRIYVGQSTLLEKAWGYRYKTLNCKGQRKLFFSLQKYRPENHQFEILQECSLEDLNKLETHWKQYYLYINNQDWDKVLFCELYDLGGGPKSEETKRKISENKIGFKYSEESKRVMKEKKNDPKYIKKITEIARENGKRNKGKTHSEETLQKMRESNPNKIPVEQVDKITGKVIREYYSMKEVGRVLGVNANGVTEVIHGRQKTFKGFIWRLKRLKK